MNCQNHPEIPATAYCRACGKALCEQCRHDAYGTVFCAEHAPAPAAASPGPIGAESGAPPSMTAAAGYMGSPTPYFHSDVSPGLALFLGLIPGVGAIYNGQYAKGLVHAIIWGVLCSLGDAASHSGTEVV